MKKRAEQGMTIEEAKEILAAFLDEFSRLFEPTKIELEAMKTLLRAS